MIPADNDVRSLDRIIDQNAADNNSLIPKRSNYSNAVTQESSKNAQRRLKSPKNSNINLQPQNKQQSQTKKVTLKHL